jgi:hypothetical protein
MPKHLNNFMLISYSGCYFKKAGSDLNRSISFTFAVIWIADPGSFLFDFFC